MPFPPISQKSPLNTPKRLYPILVQDFLVALVLETRFLGIPGYTKDDLDLQPPTSTSEELGLKMYSEQLVLAGAGAS